MLKPEVEAAINAQLNAELANAQEYLALSAWMEHQGYGGFASFMRHQCDEERQHAMKLYAYMCDHGARITLTALPEPRRDVGSVLEAFKFAQEKERGNTKAINDLYALAGRHDDYATQTMLHWFITEQVEEEKWCDDAITLLEKAGNVPGAMIMLDERYGAMGGQH